MRTVQREDTAQEKRLEETKKRISKHLSCVVAVGGLARSLFPHLTRSPLLAFPPSEGLAGDSKGRA